MWCRSSTTMFAHLVLAFATFAGLVGAQGFGSCYYPGGAIALGYYPCDPHAYTSMCCQTGWTCFSNHQCIATDPSVVSAAIPLGTAARGTCENPEWDNNNCGSFCLNEPVRSNNGSLKACGGNRWCCQPESDSGLCSCDSGVGTFSVPAGVAQTIIGVVGLQHTSTASSSSRPTSAAQISSKSSATSSALSSSATSSSATSSPSSTSSPVSTTLLSTTTITPSTTSKTSSSSTTSASPTDTATSSPSVTSTLAFKLGLGITIPLLAIVAFLIWCFLVRPRRSSSSSRFGYESSSGYDTPPHLRPEPGFGPGPSPMFQLPVPHPNENRTSADIARSQSRASGGPGPRGSFSALPVIPERNPHWTVRRPVPNRDGISSPDV